MTYNLLYKVGANKMYKTYTHGEYREVHQSFNELHKRATNKTYIPGALFLIFWSRRLTSDFFSSKKESENISDIKIAQSG